ncbi:MAG: GntR family transcriptional regulator [Clostridia bacterium]|nr:GntR family transcriptional regulator [Clostridia bacterium]
MIKIDARSSKPIYEQIVDGIKENILKGILLPGQKIPSVREMSKLITANPNTVSKAYAELERQKVIETLIGKGTFVSSSYSPKADEDRLENIRKHIKDIVIEAHYMGLDQSKLLEILNDIYSEMERK